MLWKRFFPSRKTGPQSQPWVPGKTLKDKLRIFLPSGPSAGCWDASHKSSVPPFEDTLAVSTAGSTRYLVAPPPVPFNAQFEPMPEGKEARGKAVPVCYAGSNKWPSRGDKLAGTKPVRGEHYDPYQRSRKLPVHLVPSRVSPASAEVGPTTAPVHSKPGKSGHREARFKNSPSSPAFIGWGTSGFPRIVVSRLQSPLRLAGHATTEHTKTE